MRSLNLFLLSPLVVVVIASIVIGATPYQLRHRLRCALPPTAAELLLSGMQAIERAHPFPHDADITSVYELLCLSPAASVEDLKHAFREFALRHHPDKSMQESTAMYTTARAALDSLVLDRENYDGDTNRCIVCVASDSQFPSASLALSVARRESELGPKCLAVGSSAAVLAFILYIFLQAHHATSIAASNQRAYEIVAAKKQAERALMMAERQKQVLLREQQAADAAAAAVVHEAEVRREYTALRVELRYPETVPDRHMMLSSMEKKIVEMKRELLRLQVLRQEQQAVNALRNQQQHQAVLAAAEREAKKPKPLPRQPPASPEHSLNSGNTVNGPSSPVVSPSDRLADRLAAARRMQEQQLQAVAAANAASAKTASPRAKSSSSAASAPAAAAVSDNTVALAVLVKVLTRPQPTDYALQLLPSATIADVRQQLQLQHALAPWPGMKIVYNGSVLSDSQTLKSIEYSVGKSLVVTAPPASSSSNSSSSPSSAAAINDAIDAAYGASLAADFAPPTQ